MKERAERKEKPKREKRENGACVKLLILLMRRGGYYTITLYIPVKRYL